jgi:hypothetical protein
MRYSGHPSLDEHMALLGFITHFWNDLESRFAIIPLLYSHDVRATAVFSKRLRPRDLLDAIKEIIEEREKDVRLRGAVNSAIDALNILRENRNILVHSTHIIASGRADVAWVRNSKSSPGDPVLSSGSARELRLLLRMIRRLADYVTDLTFRIDFGREQLMGPQDKQPPLPRKFPLPRKLEQIDPPARQNGKHPPRSSPG